MEFDIWFKKSGYSEEYRGMLMDAWDTAFREGCDQEARDRAEEDYYRDE